MFNGMMKSEIKKAETAANKFFGRKEREVLKMTEYRVQAILIDDTGRNEIETVTDSFKSTDYQMTLDYLMKRHKTSNKYLYIVVNADTQEVVYRSRENKYYR